jgi:hypothetical protein
MALGLKYKPAFFPLKKKNKTNRLSSSHDKETKRKKAKQLERRKVGETINYRCEDCPFLVSASCVTISNPDSLSTSETGVIPGIRS